MTDDEKIEKIIDSLSTNALGDIQRASSGGSKMGAFILCSCLIDAISGFEKGSDTTKTDYIAFVGRRLGAYKGEDLYLDLRCKLVHSYSEGGSYLFVDNQNSLHGTLHNNKTLINLENFISDIASALQAFAADIRGADPTLRANALARLNSNRIIGISTQDVKVQIKDQNTSTITRSLTGAD